MDFKKAERELGKLYHLIILKSDPLIDNPVRFVEDFDKNSYSGVDYHPLFLDGERKIMIATDYTICYPKVYVRDFIVFENKHLPIERNFIQ